LPNIGAPSYTTHIPTRSLTRSRASKLPY
jgi:hypothetical protein